MMKFAVDFEGPIAVRYPRGEAYDGLKDFREPVELGKAEWIYKESEIVLMAVGSMVGTAATVREMLKKKGYPVSLDNARFVKPIDTAIIKEAAANHKLIVTMEENVLSGGYSDKVIQYVNQKKIPVSVLPVTLPDSYVEHGNVNLLKKEVGIDADTIYEKIVKWMMN